MANFGAKPTGIASPAALVRHGFTRAQRLLVANREPRIMAELAQSYDRATVDELCVLCDRFKERRAS